MCSFLGTIPIDCADRLGLETTICYNAFNMVGSVTDANGIATEYTYSPAGLVTRIVRKDGAQLCENHRIVCHEKD